MRAEDIHDSELRSWVLDHQEARIKDRRAAKQGADDLKAIWTTYTEHDWWCFRELPGLREKAKAFWERLPEMMEDKTDGRFYPKPEWEHFLDSLIQSEIEKAPRITKAGASYLQPYSLGLEVQALAKIAGIDLPKRRRLVEVTDFNP